MDNKVEGIVRKTENNIAYVFIKRSSMCGDNCAHCNMCDGKETLIPVKNAKDAKVGDSVMLRINPEAGIRASFLVYGVPVFIFALGIIVLYFLKLLTDLNLVFLFLAVILWYVIIFVLQKKNKLSFFEAEIIREEKNV